MSKFNTTNTNKTENRSGYPAYPMTRRDALVTAALTTMFGKPKYYGSTDSQIVKLATECAAEDPDFLARLAVYARREGNMRSVSHVLAAVIAHDAHAYTRRVIRRVVLRPDDITEIMACYRSMYGRPFPNAMKREVAAVLQNFDEYQIAKYNGGNKSIKFRDVLRITHPVPKDAGIEALFGKILNDTLQTPYTWETELSARGNTKEVWDELIASGKVGYMALLRNLRNIVKSGADIGPVLERLSDPAQVKNSRQLPFRFYSACRTLNQEALMTPDIRQALEDALQVSIDNMDRIPGRTLIAVDSSGSMEQALSGKSQIRCCDVATLFGAMANHICEDAIVCYFDCADRYAAFRRFGHTVDFEDNSYPGYHIAHYEDDESILDICEQESSAGGGTDLSLPMKFALEEDALKETHPFDRIIYFSDNECNSSYRGVRATVQGLVDTYRRKYNPDFWVHGVDLAGYGTQQFLGSRFNLIAGWSDTVLPFILLAEQGVGTLSETIGSYPIE